MPEQSPASNRLDTSTAAKRIVGRELTWLVAFAAFPCLLSAWFGMRDSEARPLAVSATRPSLVFREYLVDAGPRPVDLRPKIRQSFYFTNAGSEPVRITDLVPNCGCMKPEISSREIAPGQRGELILPVDTRNQPPGVREYTVAVRYEDPKPREVTLTYRATLPEKKVTLEPRVLMVMGKIAAGDKDVVTIADHRPEKLSSPMKITSVQSSSSLFTAELSGQTTAEGLVRTSISVTYGDHIPLGQHRGLITVQTDDSTYPVLQFPVILGDRRRPADEPVVVEPESGRVIVNVNNPAASNGSRVSVRIPAQWKFSHIETFPSQLVAKVLSTTAHSPEQTAMELELGLSDNVASGTEMATVTIHATDGDAPEMVSFPVTLITP